MTLNETTVSGGVAGPVASPAPDCSACGGGVLTCGKNYYQAPARATIMNSTISGNSASDGGGIGACSYSSLMITNSTLSGNTAEFFGGGVYAEYGTLTMVESTVSDNSADLVGGGIHMQGYEYGSGSIMGSTVSGNSAYNGGGVANGEDSSLSIMNSTISGNSAYVGGGVSSAYGANLTIMNSTLFDNSADRGGGILNNGPDASASITNSTVSGNSANAGGGLFNYYDATLNIANTILTNNKSGLADNNCSEDVTSLGHNLADDETCSPNGTTDKTPVTFPGLTVGLGAFVADGPGRGHFPLLSESSAIDMGDPAVCPPTDQLGRTRNGVCDIGAVEFSGFILEGALDADGNGAPDALTDGILFLRFLFGFTGEPLIAGVLGPGCTHCTPEEVEAFLEKVPPDTDGNAVDDALTDGILILRFLFGFRGNALIDGAVAPDCTRCTAEEIEAFLEPGLGS